MKSLRGKSLYKSNKESGQTLVEYVLIVALIAVAAIFGMKLLGGGVNSRFTNVNEVVAAP